MDRPGLPIIAVPTTAGTGWEATRFTVITDETTDEKMLCIGLAFLPVAALVDYELTLTKPLRLTADTGVDALTHAIEAYVSRRANPFSDSLALAAMKAIAANLRTVCREPDNRPARAAMMLGHAGRHGFLECERGPGSWDEPADRGLLPCAARALECHAAARRHSVFSWGGAGSIRRVRARHGRCLGA